ncbi:MAG: hypothetical protein RIG61_10740 [Deltaproteobacteria bacterium]
MYSLLESGESLVWSGRPQTAKLLLVIAPLIIFSVFWTAMSARWIYSAAGDKIPDFSNPSDYFALFGVPFVLIGLVQFLGAFWFFVRIKRLHYAVTDKKFFVLDRETVHSFTPDELSRMRGKKSFLRPGLSETSEYVSRHYPHSGKPRVSGITLAALIIGFFTIPRFREVKDMLVKMKKSGQA